MSRKTSSWFGSLVLLLTALAATSCNGGRGSRLVLITVDTLRFDAFAGSTSAMPLLRDWAREAAVFERFFASTSTTQPSHASMFTGLHPWQHGVTQNGHVLSPEHATVAENLRAAGFTTAAVVASYPVSRHFGFEQGFEHFDDAFDHGKARWLRDATEEERRAEHYYSLADTVVGKALALLDGTEEDRQFFWFHFFDSHDPYGNTREGGRRVGPKKALRLAAAGQNPRHVLRRARELYDQDVGFLDGKLREILDRLAQDEDRIATHVVIAADHGESFGEDGSTGHGSRLTAGQIHVPCLIRSPKIAPGVRNDVAGSVDVAATLYALAGVEGNGSVKGRNLLETPAAGPLAVFGMRRTYAPNATVQRLDGEKHPVETPFFYVVTEQGLVYRGNSAGVEGAGEDGAASPRFESNVESLFGAFEAELEGSASTEQTDPAAREALRALGYVG